MGIPVTLNVARDATCIYGTIGPRVERTRLHKGVIHPTENLPEEILYQFCGAPIVNRGYDNITSGEHVEYDVAENPDHKQLDGQAPVLPQGPEEHTEWKKRGFLALLKSTLFPPLLQHIFTRISQPS